MTEAWHEPRFQARMRNSALLAGQLAAAAARLGHAEQARLVQRAVAEQELAEQILADDPALGPEARAWVHRGQAEVARLRWITGIDAPPLADLEQSWRTAVDDFDALGNPFERARSATRLAGILVATGRAGRAGGAQGGAGGRTRARCPPTLGRDRPGRRPAGPRRDWA